MGGGFSKGKGQFNYSTTMVNSSVAWFVVVHAQSHASEIRVGCLLKQ